MLAGFLLNFTKLAYISSFESSTKYISCFWKHGVVKRAWILETDKISPETIIYYFLQNYMMVIVL